jgi:hypothetical protein
MRHDYFGPLHSRVGGRNHWCGAGSHLVRRDALAASKQVARKHHGMRNRRWIRGTCRGRVAREWYENASVPSDRAVSMGVARVHAAGLVWHVERLCCAGYRPAKTRLEIFGIPDCCGVVWCICPELRSIRGTCWMVALSSCRSVVGPRSSIYRHW